MRANLPIDYPGQTGSRPFPGLYWLGPAGEADESGRRDPSSGPHPTERDDLPYKVELWSMDKTLVEQVLAVTANGSIGYAAFYGATREFPHRYITLRHKNRIVSRWNGPRH